MTDKKTERISAKVESLGPRRFQQLTDENRKLRQHMASVMERLKENERLFMRLFKLETEVLASSGPEDACFILLRALRGEFDLDLVRFWLIRESSLGNYQFQGISERDMIWIEDGEAQSMGLAKQRATLLTITPESGFAWLEPRDSHIQSMALLTLGSMAQPLGVLGMGSVHPDRFDPSEATDFLQHLAQMVGLTLENAVAREKLSRISMDDRFPGVRNAHFIKTSKDKLLSAVFGSQLPLSCLYIDVDTFPQFVKAHGKDAGMSWLAEFSKALKEQIRSRDVVSRVEESEFLVLLPLCSATKAKQLSRRILDAISNFSDDKALSISIGLASAAEDKTLKVLMQQAEQAMYVAQALGGNQLEIYS